MAMGRVWDMPLLSGSSLKSWSQAPLRQVPSRVFRLPHDFDSSINQSLRGAVDASHQVNQTDGLTDKFTNQMLIELRRITSVPPSTTPTLPFASHSPPPEKLLGYVNRQHFECVTSSLKNRLVCKEYQYEKLVGEF